jgi:hypothetical protein
MPSYPKTPPKVAELHTDLWTQVVILHGRLLAFQALFATDDGTVALLNRTAGALFEMIQRLLMASVPAFRTTRINPVVALAST